MRAHPEAAKDYVNPSLRKKEVRSKAAKQARYLKLKWVERENGNFTLKFKGHRITVYRIKKPPYENHFGFFAGEIRSERVYESHFDAQIESCKTVEQQVQSQNTGW
jgi:hypothetical protein